MTRQKSHTFDSEKVGTGIRYQTAPIGRDNNVYKDLIQMGFHESYE